MTSSKEEINKRKRFRGDPSHTPSRTNEED